LEENTDKNGDKPLNFSNNGNCYNGAGGAAQATETRASSAKGDAMCCYYQW